MSKIEIYYCFYTASLTRGGKTSLKAGFSLRLFKFPLKPIKFLTIYPRPKRDMPARTCSLVLTRID